jgi:site-specific recombinase XerC
VGEVAALHLGDVEPPTQPDQLVKVRVCGKGQKERIVWLTPSLWAVVLAWLQVRPAVDDDHLFLSGRGRPISVAGIQYRLQQHAQVAGWQEPALFGPAVLDLVGDPSPSGRMGELATH